MELHKRRKALTEPEVRYFLRQTLLALHYLHTDKVSQPLLHLFRVAGWCGGCVYIRVSLNVGCCSLSVMSLSSLELLLSVENCRNTLEGKEKEPLSLAMSQTQAS